MSLTVHQLALRLARQIGVSSFDPADPSNNPVLPEVASLHGGDLEYVVACMNGALQELWPLMPESGVEAPSVTVADVGISSDPGKLFPLPEGWEESVLLPMALRRMMAHPKFQPDSAKVEIIRQAGVAWRTLQRLCGTPLPTELYPVFR